MSQELASDLSNLQKPPKFVLWFSVYVYPHGENDRFDVMMNSLRSYSRLPLDKAYINILLDQAYEGRRSEIDEVLKVFNCPVDYEPDRYTLRTQLVTRFDQVREGLSDNDFIWLTQNDDHPYIDTSNDIVIEGLNTMAQDPHPYKSLYFSHWPEIIKLSIKQQEDQQVGNFIKWSGILCDSIQIFNVGYVSRILRELIPDDTSVRGHRIDGAIEGYHIGDGKNGVRANIYVPLKELCVHIDGYGHVGIPYHVYPILQLPFENINFNFSREELIARMTVPCGGWTHHHTGGKIPSMAADAPIPQHYIDTMLKNYNKL